MSAAHSLRYDVFISFATILTTSFLKIVFGNLVNKMFSDPLYNALARVGKLFLGRYRKWANRHPIPHAQFAHYHERHQAKNPPVCQEGLCVIVPE